MQISEKYGLVYVITKLGLLFVYDLATATAVSPLLGLAAAQVKGLLQHVNIRSLTHHLTGGVHADRCTGTESARTPFF